MARINIQKHKHWFVLYISIFLVLIIIRSFTGEIPGNGFDGFHYASMSQVPIYSPTFRQDIRLPFARRILMPQIVYLLPLHYKNGFRVLNIIAFIITATYLFMLFYKILKFELKYSYIAVFLWFSLYYGCKWCFYYPVNTDSLAHSVIIMSIYYLYKENLFLISVLFAIGILIRENIFLIMPLYYFYKQKGSVINLQRLQEMYVFLPGIFLFFALRIIIPSPGSHYSYLNVFMNYPQTHFSDITHMFRLLIHCVPMTFGALFIIILVDIKELQRLIMNQRHWLAYTLFCLILTLIGGSDINRFAFYLFPLVILLCVTIIKKHWILFSRLRYSVPLILFQLYFHTIFDTYNNNWKEKYFSMSSFHAPDIALIKNSIEFTLFAIVFLVFTYRYKQKIQNDI